MHVHMYVFKNMHMYIRIYICTYIGKYTCLPIYIMYIHACMYVCMHAFMMAAHSLLRMLEKLEIPGTVVLFIHNTHNVVYTVLMFKYSENECIYQCDQS